MLSEKMVNMLSAPLLKRKGPVPKGFVKSLVAANGGLAITEKLKERGVITTARPAVTPVLTCGNGKVTASRLVARGPMFVATATNPVKAKAIWPEAGEELAITFSVGGTALNFGNPDTPNISDWMELRSLVGAKVVNSESGETLSLEQINEEDGLRNGACLRVVLHHLSVTHVAATLQVTNKVTPQQ